MSMIVLTTKLLEETRCLRCPGSKICLRCTGSYQVSVDNAPEQQYVGSISTQEDTAKKDNDMAKLTPITVNIQKTPNHPDKPKDKWYKTSQGRIAVLKLISIVAGIAYAFITYLQWGDLRANFKIDNRAWVMPFEYKKTTDFNKNVIGANMFYKNTGKTPALDLQVFVGWAAGESLIPKRDIPSDNSPKFALAPDGVGNSAPNIPPAVVKGVTIGNPGGFIFGTIWYKDVFGYAHWNQYCVGIGPHFDYFTACTIHNATSETDENQ